MRSVQGQRGAWGGGDEAEMHYKLDKAEDSSRRRRRLKRNYDFDEHKGSAMHSLHQTAVPPTVDPVDEATRKLAGIKLTSIGALKATEEDPVLPLASDEAEEPLSPTQQQSAPTSAVEQEASEYITDCELVAPLLVTKGKLEVTTKALVFKPNPDQSIDNVFYDAKRYGIAIR